MKAMILAAGRGERMRPLTDSMPKPLLTVGSRPLIEYQIEALARAGVDGLVINLAWRGDQIQDLVGTGTKYGLSVSYSDEGAEALETGGGVYKALPQLGKAPFWLVNGDVYCEFDFPPRSLPAGTLGHLILVPNPEHNPDGDFFLDHDRVRPHGGPPSTYAGIALLHPDLFTASSAGKFPLAPLLTAAMRENAITGEMFSGYWIDVGTPDRLRELDKRLSGRGPE
jgi:MurNAc alpha-1-phosphate uridylyltransferase